MRFPWPAALVLLPLCLTPAADPMKPDAPATVAGDEEHVVILRPNRPYHFRLHLQADGRPFRSDWNDVVAHLFRFLDVNGDGVLSAAETAPAPSVEQFMQQQQSEPLEPDGPPDFGADAGKLTLDRFRAHYRHAGASLTVDLFEMSGAAELSDTLFAAVDHNRDGKLSRAELAALLDALARLDANSDELLTAQEVVGPGSAVRLTEVPRLPKKAPPVFVVPGGDKDTAWTANLITEYDRDRDGKLSQTEAGLDKAMFGRLDRDRDGKLTKAELAGWFAEPADLEVAVEMGRLSARDGRATLLGPAGVAVEHSRPGLVLLPLGDSRIDLTAVSDARRAVPIGQVAPRNFAGLDPNNDGFIDSREASRMINSPLVALLRLADLDSDGKLSQKEYTDGVELQRKLGTSTASMQFADHGRSLFDFLDADQDGRLGLREAKSAWSRLRAWDRDGDGTIVRDEIPHQFRLTVARGRSRPAGGAGMMAMGRMPAPERRVLRTAGPMWFRKMDRNGDGDVSPREFLGRADDFRRIDADGDGLIDAAEADRADSAARKK